jgi:3-phenylpropionate/trans-cinnamate dioxygenase ferredoxin subunit
MAEPGFEKVAETGDLSPGQMKPVTLGDEELLLANVDGNYCAIGNSCTYSGGTLSDGDLDGEEVECPLHGATFNVVTGEVVGPPAQEGVQAYEVRISGNDVMVGPAKG